MSAYRTPDDVVYLHVVLPNNSFYAGPMVRRDASDTMRRWLDLRKTSLDPENITLAGIQERLILRAEHVYAKSEDSWTQWVVMAGDVQAMSIREPEPDSAQERMLKAQEQAVKLMEQQLRGEMPGDEWKHPDDAEEDD